MGATVGGLTETFIVYLHKGSRWTREDLVNMAFNFLVFGLLGVMNSGLYQLQARWFGAGRSLGTLALKTSVDQFIYTPFLSNPVHTLAFLWKAEDFSLRSTVAKLSHFKQLYVIRSFAGSYLHHPSDKYDGDFHRTKSEDAGRRAVHCQ